MLGIFDSGSGGLSVLKEIRRRAPSLDIVYFGDIKNAPYGGKTPSELRVLTISVVERLLEHGAGQIVSACNSVSAREVIAGAHLVDSGLIVEMVEPTVRALATEKDKKILVIATPATISSGLYQNEFGKIGVKVEAFAISDLAGAIEFGEPDKKVEKIIYNIFFNLPPSTFNLLILACTHYPLVRHLFEKVFRKLSIEAEIFDPAPAVAEEVIGRFGVEGSGQIHFLITKDSFHFRSRADKFFPENSYTIEVI